MVRRQGRVVVAGLDGPPAEAAVLRAASLVGDLLHVPVRPVHVVPGPGLRGEARRSALASIVRGEKAEIVGRPEALLTALAQAAGTALTVLGARQRERRPGGRRGAGTAIAVARRVTSPLLLVPPAAWDWPGPRHVLTALDGTGPTALAAAAALSGLVEPTTVVVPLHVADGTTVHSGWDTPDSVAHRTLSVPSVPGGDGPAHRQGPLGGRILSLAEELTSNLVVLVWSRHIRGPYGAAVLDVLSSTPVPVLLVPLTPLPAA